MTRIIDKRLNGKNKNVVNRSRFLHRFREQIKASVGNAVNKRNITDINTSENIFLTNKDIEEPVFAHDHIGNFKLVLPGNQDFVPGDRIDRPKSAHCENQSTASNSSETGEDEFSFELSKEEFLDLFFEDLKLPNLIKKEFKSLETIQSRRSGFNKDGVPTNINIIRSMKMAKSRKIATTGACKLKINELEDELLKLQSTDLNNSKEDLINELKTKISNLKTKIKSIPFIDKVDIRYHNRVKRKEPATQAVMFCLMDVSGSMDEAKKDVAKRFFVLLYLFLKKNYNKIDLVFIRHHTSAKEVDEKEFFYSRETGGTVVSSALELMIEIINTKYPQTDWNIYGAEASDGDNWNNDSPKCHDLLINNILPKVQYFSYIEIMPRHHQSLWEAYSKINNIAKNFAMQHIQDISEIYPVFRELFESKTNAAS